MSRHKFGIAHFFAGLFRARGTNRTVDELIADAREPLRKGFVTLIEANIQADKNDDEELGDELYRLSHRLMYVMTKLHDLQRERSSDGA